MKRRMKVIRTIESFFPFVTGPAKQAYNISSGLEKRGIRCPIFTTYYKAEGASAHQKKQGVEVFRFPVSWHIMKYLVSPALKKKLADSDFDILHSHSYRSYQSEVAYKIARLRGKPFVLSNHGTFISYKVFVKGLKKLPYRFYDLFHKKVALDADAVIVNSRQELKEALEFGVPRKNVHIIPVGIDASLYRPMKKRGRGLTLLWVGRITPDRNLEVVLRAMKFLANKNVRLKIVGNEYRRTGSGTGGELERLKRFAKELGVAKRVDFIPWTEKRAIIEFRKADVFVYTSVWENFGQSILEAAAAGLPLVCTRVGVALDLIEEGKTGEFVKEDDPMQIVTAVSRLSNPKSRKKASRLLINKVKNDYSWNKIIERYIKIYKYLCEK